MVLFNKKSTEKFLKRIEVEVDKENLKIDLWHKEATRNLINLLNIKGQLTGGLRDGGEGKIKIEHVQKKVSSYCSILKKHYKNASRFLNSKEEEIHKKKIDQMLSGLNKDIQKDAIVIDESYAEFKKTCNDINSAIEVKNSDAKKRFLRELFIAIISAIIGAVIYCACN